MTAKQHPLWIPPLFLIVFFLIGETYASSSATVKYVYVDKETGETVVDSVDYAFSYFLSQCACQFFGLLYPAYASFKAIKSSSADDHKQWLMYWLVFSFFHLMEYFLVIILVWIPFYWEIKCLFLFWLQYPDTRGASYIYLRWIRPVLKTNEQQIDSSMEKGVELLEKEEREASQSSLWRNILTQLLTMLIKGQEKSLVQTPNESTEHQE